ncbi:hypothetical protein KUCAC02_005469, partial [Chaenocephalus aceratus]
LFFNPSSTPTILRHFVERHTHRCATPVPLNLGGLYLYHLLCQLCRESKHNNIRERDKQTAAENRETEERHQRSA